MIRAATGVGFAIGLATLAGCVAPPAPPSAVLVAPSPPVAVGPVALIPVAPPPPAPVVRHHTAMARPSVHHHMHRYVSRKHVLVSGGPYCGSPVRPCNVEHVTVPVQ